MVAQLVLTLATPLAVTHTSEAVTMSSIKTVLSSSSLEVSELVTSSALAVMVVTGTVIVDV